MKSRSLFQIIFLLSLLTSIGLGCSPKKQADVIHEDREVTAIMDETAGTISIFRKGKLSPLSPKTPNPIFAPTSTLFSPRMVKANSLNTAPDTTNIKPVCFGDLHGSMALVHI